MTAEQKTFLNKIAPLAQKEMSRGILASLTIAQAIIESNWGTSPLAKGHNYFGIKWKDGCGYDYQEKVTKEWVKDHYIDIVAKFRKYPSMEVGVRDHTDFLLRERYKPLWGVTDYKDACRIIRECGYATSPTYTETLIKTIETYGLSKFDQEAKVKIYLSPSSQEHNAYATGNTVEETVCNKIVDVLAPILTVQGIEVKRNNPANNPNQHADESNAWGADYHIPIHTNAGGARGCEVFVYDKRKPYTMAQNIYNELSAITPTNDRGVQANKTFAEIKNTKAPCTYIEVEFHDSKEGSEWILSNINNIAEAISRGIFKTLGITVGRKMSVKANVLNIRKGPGTNYEIVGKLKANDIVTISEVNGDWGRTKDGWVHIAFVSVC